MNNGFNPLQLIQSGANPQQVILNYLEQNMQNTPLGANLLNLAKNNRTAEIEQIVRNIYEQQGRDFDTEFNAFKRMLGVK